MGRSFSEEVTKGFEAAPVNSLPVQCNAAANNPVNSDHAIINLRSTPVMTPREGINSQDYQATVEVGQRCC
jgi:hypothetical protein